MASSTVFLKAIDRLVATKMLAVDILIEQVIDPIADVGNPEKVIGKKYDDWTSEDFTMLSNIYGKVEPNILSNLIFRKEYDKLRKAEFQVGV